MASELALLGGSKAVQADQGDMFDWPIVTPEIEAAILEVLRAGKMSGTDVTKLFEQEYAAWHGVKYALAHNTGTAAIHGAFFGLGIGKGDEVICPSITYWALLRAGAQPWRARGSFAMLTRIRWTLTRKRSRR